MRDVSSYSLESTNPSRLLKTSGNEVFKPTTLNENSKRAAGIEPASSAWKAEVLPLNYARKTRPGLDLQHYDLRRPGAP